MRFAARLLCIIFVVGCNEVTNEPDTALMTTIFKVGRGGGEEEGVPLEGVRLCQTGTNNCDISNANGEATLELPVGLNISYTADKEGYASRLFPGVIPLEGQSLTRNFGTDTFIAGLFERVGSPYPMRGTGSININTFPKLAGVTYELVGATNNPYYADEEGLWTADLTATTSWGGGGFTEVTPGDFQIELSGTARGCVPLLAWPGEEAATIRVPVLEGYITTASVRCPPPL